MFLISFNFFWVNWLSACLFMACFSLSCQYSWLWPWSAHFKWKGVSCTLMGGESLPSRIALSSLFCCFHEWLKKKKKSTRFFPEWAFSASSPILSGSQILIFAQLSLCNQASYCQQATAQGFAPRKKLDLVVSRVH